MNRSSALLVAIVGVMLVAIVVLPSLASTASIPPSAVATPIAPVESTAPAQTTQPVECQTIDTSVCVYLEQNWVLATNESAFLRWQYADSLEAGAEVPSFADGPSIIVVNFDPIKKPSAAIKAWREVLQQGIADTELTDGALDSGQMLIGPNAVTVDYVRDIAVIHPDSSTYVMSQFIALKRAGSAGSVYLVQLGVPIGAAEYDAMSDSDKEAWFADMFAAFDELVNSRMYFTGGS